MRKDFVLARLETLYGDYLKTVERLERERRPGEGLFGTKGPADDPCHDRFASDLESLLGDFAAEDPDSGTRRAVFTTPSGRRRRRRETRTST